ncbi:MAG: hypoxanthine phosphoribosyltransferase [Clostridia bacterium]|nr:hypoxanthine phosphoribosyltransferase [Clostridia bacterium]
MYEDIESVLLDRDTIHARIKEMAAELEKDYRGESVVMICILRGASVFFCDLVRELDLDVRFEFMSVSSYGAGTTSSGEVRIVKDINAPLSGKNVIIVEDIIDSGNTLSYLKRLLEQRNPKSLKICALLDKPSRRKVELQGDYVGFTVEDKFLVGYGLDYAEKYRNLKDIGVLKPEIYQK